jgi:hypothetical protein
MGKNEIPRKIINSKPEGSRTADRPTFGGWIVVDDSWILAMQGWWMVTRDNQSGMRVIQGADAHCGL